MKNYVKSNTVIDHATQIADELATAFFSDVPVIGIVYNAVIAGASIKESLFQKKLHKFLTDEAFFTEKKEEILKKLNENEHEIGIKLFCAIDHISDLTKPILLSSIFKALIENKITNDDFLLFAHCIENTYLGDLNAFINFYSKGDINVKLSEHRLSNTCLLEPTAPGYDATTEYTPSTAGSKFMNIFSETDTGTLSF